VIAAAYDFKHTGYEAKLTSSFLVKHRPKTWRMALWHKNFPADSCLSFCIVWEDGARCRVNLVGRSDHSVNAILLSRVELPPGLLTPGKYSIEVTLTKLYEHLLGHGATLQRLYLEPVEQRGASAPQRGVIR